MAVEILEEPGRRPPAPGALRLVQQFVNTNDREAGHDRLATPRALAHWFGHWTRWTPSATPTREEHALALVVREGLRDLSDSPPRVGAEFEAAIRAVDVRLVVQGAHLRLDSDTRLGKALSPILDAVRAAMDDGSWARMKVCQRDRCRWLYYDTSRNSSAKWCATEVCGSREKAGRAYRRKRRAE